MLNIRNVYKCALFHYDFHTNDNHPIQADPFSQLYGSKNPTITFLRFSIVFLL